MSKPIKLREGDLVVCHHYKDKPKCKVTYIDRTGGIWVRIIYPAQPRYATGSWWGRRSWFRKLPEKKS